MKTLWLLALSFPLFFFGIGGNWLGGLSGKNPNFFGVYSVWRKKPIRLSMLDFGFLVWYGIY